MKSQTITQQNRKDVVEQFKLDSSLSVKDYNTFAHLLILEGIPYHELYSTTFNDINSSDINNIKLKDYIISKESYDMIINKLTWHSPKHQLFQIAFKTLDVWEKYKDQKTIEEIRSINRTQSYKSLKFLLNKTTLKVLGEKISPINFSKY